MADIKKTGIKNTEKIESDKSKKKNVKRIAALLGVVILVLMYVLTLIFAITDNAATMDFFRASIALTIAVPIMIYAYQLVYKVLKDSNK